MIINQLYRVAVFIALLAAFQFATTETASAQISKQVKISMHKADVISKVVAGRIEMPPESPVEFLTGGKPEDFAYVIPSAFVSISTGAPINYGGVAIFPPGAHLLGARYRRTYSHTSAPVRRGNMIVIVTTYYSEVSQIIPIRVDMQPGKVYSFKEQIDGRAFNDVNISVREVTDAQQIAKTAEKAKDIIANPEDHMAFIVTAKDYRGYMDWWIANTGALNGSYISKDQKTEIRFDGDRFQAFHTAPLYASNSFLYGTYLFDGQTIILQADSAKTTTVAAIRSKPGKEEIKKDTLIDVLYYKLIGDELKILAQKGESGFSFEDTYHKRTNRETTTIVSSPEEETTGTMSAKGMASLDIAWRVEGGVLMVTGEGEIPGNPAWVSAIDQFSSAVIGDGITSLGHHAFAMSKITSIVLGKDLESLKTYALFKCSDLMTVEVRNPVPPKVGKFAFMMTPIGKAKLIVPAGSKAAYEKNGDWKKFGAIEER